MWPLHIYISCLMTVKSAAHHVVYTAVCNLLDTIIKQELPSVKAEYLIYTCCLLHMCIWPSHYQLEILLCTCQKSCCIIIMVFNVASQMKHWVFFWLSKTVLTLLGTGATGKGQTRSDLLNISRENPTI